MQLVPLAVAFLSLSTTSVSSTATQAPLSSFAVTASHETNSVRHTPSLLSNSLHCGLCSTDNTPMTFISSSSNFDNPFSCVKTLSYICILNRLNFGLPLKLLMQNLQKLVLYQH